ncbi:MAG: hypothetical protein JW754_00795 [Candidatus Aenigmarchaeota archaeon]|nr:hypothetical protein [Candidatus Aenigmarchaeota archaeon]
MEIENKELFLRYAIPCGEVLVRRGDLQMDMLEKLNEMIERKRDIDLPVGRLFPVAGRMCTILAKEMGKDRIDDDVIRRYFLHEHEKAIKWRSLFFRDIDLKKCMVKPGRVMETGERIVLNTPLGKRVTEKSFEPELRRNDWVSLHYDQICERLPNDQAKKMLR